MYVLKHADSRVRRTGMAKSKKKNIERKYRVKLVFFARYPAESLAIDQQWISLRGYDFLDFDFYHFLSMILDEL